jgi:hypothetical protein
MRETLGQTASDEIWSTRNPALRRNLLNVQAYLNPGQPKPKTVPTPREQKPSGSLFGTQTPEAVKKS